MIYGYARISTPKQSIERQIRNIQAAYPGATIIQEAFTGKVMNRPAWVKLVKKLQSGDTIIFDSVSRMSRDAEEGFQTYQILFARGINLIFLKERHIDTGIYKNAAERQLSIRINTGDSKTDKFLSTLTAALNELLLDLAKDQIRLAFEQSEKEVADLRQRTKEGLQTARANGKQLGQVPGKKLNTKKSVAGKQAILKHSKAFGGSLSDNECINMIGCSRNTFYRWKSELKANG